MTRSRSRTMAILRKEFIHIRRDPRSLLIAVIMPVALLFIYGYGVSSDITDIRLGVVDWSRTRESRELISAFTSSGYFAVVLRSDRYADMERALDAGDIRAALVVPAAYAADITRKGASSVQILLDGSDPNTATVAAGYAEGIVGNRSAIIVRERTLRSGGARRSRAALTPEVRVWYNEDLRSANFIVPGLIAVILAMTSALLTSGTIAGERERGTIEQLAASPASAREIMLGKIAAYVTLAFADVVLVVLVGRLWFGVPFRGSPLLLVLSSGVFLMAALGLGLLFSARMPTQQTAIVAALMTTMVPSILLSGFFFPISSMPKVVQVITTVVPARYFMVITRGIFLKGIGLAELWPPILSLAALSVVIMAAGISSFKKRV
ncbi:MAG: ABC transporter permease [Chthonomonadales bacterium]|nr:ABC transporter permease [Chthonomonadales bacterium]